MRLPGFVPDFKWCCRANWQLPYVTKDLGRTRPPLTQILLTPPMP